MTGIRASWENSSTRADFSTYVVGFGLGGTSRLQCLAKETSGKYYSTGDAGQLRKALTSTVEEIEASLKNVQLRAGDKKGEGTIESKNITWSVTSEDGEQVYNSETQSTPNIELKPGRYTARDKLNDRTKSESFEVTGGRNKVEVPFDRSASVAAPNQVAQGSRFKVTWDGPAISQSFVSIARQDQYSHKYIDKVEGRNLQRPAELMAPAKLGEYEVRYVSGSGSILAQTTVEVVKTTITLDAPGTVEAGSPFDVKWTGPGEDKEWIGLYKQDDHRARKDLDRVEVSEGSPVTLRAPDGSGTYDLHYMSESNNAMTEAPVSITVKRPKISLEAPRSVQAGSEFEVTWDGPDHDDDWIGLFEEGGTWGHKSLDDEETSGGNPVTLRAPDEPGTYKIRYMSGTNNTHFESISFTVE